MEEENKNISEQMEEIIQKEEVKDSGLTQLKYFFTSWTKYFNSVKIAPKFLIFTILMLVLVVARLPFKEVEKNLVLESTREILYQQFETSSLYANYTDAQLDQIAEAGLKATENMYSTPIFILSNSVTLFVTVLITGVFFFVLAKVFKSKIGFSNTMGAMFGYGLILAIEYLVYSIFTTLTGSFVNITSLGIFTMGASQTDIIYVVANYISAGMIIKAIYTYFMSKELFDIEKNKSIYLTVLTVVIPLAISVGYMAMTKNMMGM